MLKLKTCEGDSVVDLDGNVAYLGIAAHLKNNRLTVTYQTPTGKQILGCYTRVLLGGKSQGHGGLFWVGLAGIALCLLVGGVWFLKRRNTQYSDEEELELKSVKE